MQRIDSRMYDVIRGESWFTRFMRLANAMYSHRVNNGSKLYNIEHVQTQN